MQHETIAGMAVDTGLLAGLAVLSSSLRDLTDAGDPFHARRSFGHWERERFMRALNGWFIFAEGNPETAAWRDVLATHTDEQIYERAVIDRHIQCIAELKPYIMAAIARIRVESQMPEGKTSRDFRFVGDDDDIVRGFSGTASDAVVTPAVHPTLDEMDSKETGEFGYISGIGRHMPSDAAGLGINSASRRFDKR